MNHWREMLAKIPETQYPGLSLFTSTGLEISVGDIIRIEESYLIIRGRISGMDLVRFLFLPFDKLELLATQVTVREKMVREWWGEDVTQLRDEGVMRDDTQPQPEAPAATPPPAAGTPTPAPTPAPAPRPAPPPPPTLQPAGAPLPGKAALLERLRARSTQAMPKPPDNK